MKKIIKSFDDITSFTRYLNSGTTQPAFKGCESSLRTDDTKKRVTKTDTYAEADALLLYGDKGLAKKIEEAGVYTTRMKLRCQQNKRQIYSAVVGIAPHVPNAIAGVPTSMINVREVRQKQKVINIAFCCSCGAGVSADEIIKASAQFISAAMQIEASGVRTNVYLAECSKSGRDTTAYLVRIKSAGQPFDVLKMAYPMAHPSMLRRHFFRAMEVTEGVSADFACTYGSALDNKESIAKAIGRNDMKIISIYDCFGRCSEDIAKKIVEQ